MKSRIVQPAPSFQPPETCTEHPECQAAQASIADLKRNALDHYEKISAAAHEWHSVIPKAIAAYFDKRLEAENAATSMRSACIEKVKSMADEVQRLSRVNFDDASKIAHHLRKAASALESLSIQEQEASASSEKGEGNG